jgi:hypothetical protein
LVSRKILVERFRTAVDLWVTGVIVHRETLRRRYPQESADEIEIRLNRWLAERPGASHGDGPRQHSR